MELRIDEQANAAYLRLAKGKVHVTRQVRRFGVDYARSGKVLGVEILGLREHLAKHGRVRIPPSVLKDRPPPRSGKGIRALVGILTDEEGDQLMRHMERLRGYGVSGLDERELRTLLRTLEFSELAGENTELTRKLTVALEDLKPMFTVIHSWDEIPEFTDLAEESRYWDTHTLSEELLSQSRSTAKALQERLNRRKKRSGESI